MKSVAQQVEDKYLKKTVVDVKSGDTVKVHQKIREAGKERVQIFEGMVIRTNRAKSLTSTFTVRRIASGIGVEKTYLIHSPSILKVEVIKRSKVRRNYLSYMRGLRGKSARLSGIEFDRDAVNVVEDEQAEVEESKIHEEKEKAHEEAEAKKAAEQAAEEAKVQAALAKRQAADDKQAKEAAETSTDNNQK